MQQRRKENYHLSLSPRTSTPSKHVFPNYITILCVRLEGFSVWVLDPTTEKTQNPQKPKPEQQTHLFADTTKNPFDFHYLTKGYTLDTHSSELLQVSFEIASGRFGRSFQKCFSDHPMLKSSPSV